MGIELKSVKEGIVYNIRNGIYTLFRINGTAAYGKKQIQIAECKDFPTNIESVVWSNFEAVKPQDINIYGQLYKTY